MTISHVTGLILIDCWENDHIRSNSNKNTKRYVLPKQRFFTGLVQNLKRFNFAGVINASTNLTPNPNIPLDQGQKTSVIVQEYLNQHSMVATLSTQSEFFELRKSDQWKNIAHWLVVGTTWQICCHLNDMGLCSFTTMMRQHPELNFYGAPWGFLKHNLTTTTDEDFANDHLTWSGCGELFKLTAEAPGGQRFAIHPTVAIRNKYIDATPH